MYRYLGILKPQRCLPQRWGSVSLVTVLLLMLGSPPRAPARPATPPLPDLDEYADDGFGMDLSAGLLAGFSYHSAGVGTEINFAYPILANGIFDHPVYRDALHLSLGLDFWRFAWDEAGNSVEVMYFAPNFGLRYAIYLLDTLAPYVWLRIGPALARADGTSGSTRLYWSTGAGVMWDLLDWLSVRGEFDWGRFRDTLRVGLLVRF